MDKLYLSILFENKNRIPHQINDQIRDFFANNEDRFKQGRLKTSDIILIFAQSNAWATQAIKQLRAEVEQFLKPIILYCDFDAENLSLLADAITPSTHSYQQIEFVIEPLVALAKRVHAMAEIAEKATSVTYKQVQLLRFLISRENYKLAPQRKIESSLGYTYPLASALFGGAMGSEKELLNQLRESSLLRGDLHDKVNICPYCHHMHINFREVCPHCNSLKVHEEITLHHFRCGYVGKESEFKKGYDLVCPKCSHILKHIGVDYDKPSEILWCEECNSNFAEPLLRCFCLNSAHHFTPDEALVEDIEEFEITQEGKRAAAEGILPGIGLLDIFKRQLRFYKNEVFREFLRVEYLRCQRYKYASTAANLSLRDADEILAENPMTRTRKFQDDFAAILHSTFRSSDLFTNVSNEKILVLFPNSNVQQCEIAMSRLSERVKEAFNVEIAFEHVLLDLSKPFESADAVMEQLE